MEAVRRTLVKVQTDIRLGAGEEGNTSVGRQKPRDRGGKSAPQRRIPPNRPSKIGAPGTTDWGARRGSLARNRERLRGSLEPVFPGTGRIWNKGIQHGLQEKPPPDSPRREQTARPAPSE